MIPRALEARRKPLVRELLVQLEALDREPSQQRRAPLRRPGVLAREKPGEPGRKCRSRADPQWAVGIEEAAKPLADRGRRGERRRVARDQIAGAPARGAASDRRVALEEDDAPAPPRQLERDRGADHATSDDEHLGGSLRAGHRAAEVNRERCAGPAAVIPAARKPRAGWPVSVPAAGRRAVDPRRPAA